MAMTWSKWNNLESFKKHVEQMRLFHQSHSNNLDVRVSRRKLINTLWPLLVTNTMRNTGGSTGPAGMMDWSVFVPIGEGTAYRFSLN